MLRGLFRIVSVEYSLRRFSGNMQDMTNTTKPAFIQNIIETCIWVLASVILLTWSNPRDLLDSNHLLIVFMVTLPIGLYYGISEFNYKKARRKIPATRKETLEDIAIMVVTAAVLAFIYRTDIPHNLYPMLLWIGIIRAGQLSIQTKGLNRMLGRADR